MFTLLVKQFNQLRASREELALKSHELKIAHAHTDAAVSNIAQGISMFDADQRLIMCNSQYLATYGYSPSKVKPGCTFREIFEQTGSSDKFPATAEEYTRHMKKLINWSAPYILKLASGRVISISARPMPEGGWVRSTKTLPSVSRGSADGVPGATRCADRIAEPDRVRRKIWRSTATPATN